MPAIDYNLAAELLRELFTEAETHHQNNTVPSVEIKIKEAADTLFFSTTQSYREALLGCGLARLLDASINIRHPYMKHGHDAFNGRTLDERVINPFLQDRMIPCSRGPYLASFRRSVTFTPDTAKGLRDKAGYEAMLAYIAALEKATNVELRNLIVYLLYRFIVLRNTADIPLSRISRLSLEQYEVLLTKLLQVQSGGLIPVLLTVATLHTIKRCFSLSWEIDWQGINVADRTSGVGGDVTVKQYGSIVLSIEVTERPIEKSRVVATFNAKIVRAGIEDYLFLYSVALPTGEARQAARKFFSQGHEINFLQVQEWIINNLGTIGAKCRGIFMNEVIELFAMGDIPASIKVAWNDAVKEVVGT